MKLAFTIVAIAFCGTALSAGPIAPVAFYQFNNAGNPGLDSSGNGYNLNLSGSGSVSISGSGPNGQGAATFTGTEWFSASTFPALVPTGNSSYTIAAWVDSSTTPEDYGIVGWGNYGSTSQVDAFRLSKDGGQDGVVNYHWGGAGNDLYDNDSTIFDGKWHFVVATYNSGTDTRTIYIDPLNGGPTSQDNPVAGSVPMEDFTVGLTCDNCNDTGFGDGETFAGEMRDVSIYNVALTEAQVLAVETQQLGTPEPATLFTLLPALLLLRRRVSR